MTRHDTKRRAHPGDRIQKKTGVPHWVGTRREPRAVDFDPTDASCMEFLYATARQAPVPLPILPSFLVLAGACSLVFAGSNMGVNLCGCTAMRTNLTLNALVF